MNAALTIFVDECCTPSGRANQSSYANQSSLDECSVDLTPIFPYNKTNKMVSDVTGDESGSNHGGASDHTAGRLGKEQRA
ncbi:hypothetical protein Back11_51810 [Paenibacillus baekrokdamisoli]|uniref:Uncharacterized protein n=1 Tax=Paenibacillus baekrokdamisoli TaxID=1712516 RepID=A0A3G9IZ41_9BACL|nr:hypothetical protein Back11_51810 [Paenibacillus baekrokdamisoli]